MAQNEETIRGFNKQILGFVVTKPNGDQVFKNFYRQILGYYRASENHTTDAYFRIISKGNTGISLIMNQDKRWGNLYG